MSALLRDQSSRLPLRQTSFYQRPSPQSVSTSLPAGFVFKCCLTAAGGSGSSDWKEFNFGTTHFEFKMEGPFSGIRLLHWKRIMLVLFNVLTSFLPRCQFFKTNMETIQVLIISQDFATTHFHFLIRTHTWQSKLQSTNI